ncbi:unnamed protein product [Rotaria sordida]|uniref:Uncharacterized protein n=1 Tax=Rotaria sordida TaxID=392033 RepID=A0A815S9P7_9BILA|nr:unnamed protein product [Rotaria sordida]
MATSTNIINIERSISTSINNNTYYPTINWKQLREKKYENSLDEAKTFISATLSRRPLLYQTTKTSNLNTSSHISLLTYGKNQPNFQKRIEQFHATSTNPSNNSVSPTLELPLSYAPSLISIGGPRSPSSSSSRPSNEIRTPLISPTSSPRPRFTISRLTETSMTKLTGGPKKPGHYNQRPSSPHPHPHLDNSNHLPN